MKDVAGDVLLSVFNFPGGQLLETSPLSRKNLKWEAYHFPVGNLPLPIGRKPPPRGAPPRGAGASGDGSGGLKMGVLRKAKVGSGGKSQGPPPTSNLTVIWEEFISAGRSKWVKMGQSELSENW